MGEAINVILIIFYLAVVIYLVVLVARFVSAHEKIANNIAEYLIRRSEQSRVGDANPPEGKQSDR